ncbi:MAG TPA: hypothetical protein VK427_12465, partial [Kofleriaceae bacterium]|nr:hypothetical protein [Kofleriaceae bacterium]
HKHVITIALGADLDDARVKDPDVPWQRLVLGLGMLVAAIRWLVDQLGHEALEIHLSFPPKLLAHERELVSLLLEGEVTSGIVTIVEETPADAVRHAHDVTNAIADLVVVSMGPVPDLPKRVRALHLCLGAAAPYVVELSPRPGATPEPTPDTWLEWSEVTEDLLRWLV